jgi:predicted pyridoxine 5'-phosphate oxidase superfamily flavin-nucleotide-binding protein
VACLVSSRCTLAFADYRGNRQYISLGNLNADNRVALIMVDYPNRRRMKIYAHVEVKDLAADPALAEKLIDPSYKAKPERAYLLHLTAFDWNCPQHITPRYSQAELEPALAPVRMRLEKLEAENAELRAKLAKQEDTEP